MRRSKRLGKAKELGRGPFFRKLNNIMQLRHRWEALLLKICPLVALRIISFGGWSSVVLGHLVCGTLFERQISVSLSGLAGIVEFSSEASLPNGESADHRKFIFAKGFCRSSVNLDNLEASLLTPTRYLIRKTENLSTRPYTDGVVSMLDRNDVCDYIIVKVKEAGEGLNHLKLQKLLYYVQAWNLAFRKCPLFEGKFQAWVHGPVNREIYDRFVPRKSLYSEIQDGDASLDFDPASIPEPDRLHIDAVLEAYAPFSGSQLEEMTHKEAPWIEARRGCRPSQRCEVIIDENRMMSYYASLAEIV